jgi:hypothetical protein
MTTTTQRGGPSKTLRFAKGTDLLAWYVKHAADEGISPNAAILIGLAYYRAAVESGTTHQERG